MLAMTSMLGLTCCTTLQIENNLVWLPVPDPIVDDEPVVKIDLTTETVIMPYWYWQKIEIYIITTEANKKKLKQN